MTRFHTGDLACDGCQGDGAIDVDCMLTVEVRHVEPLSSVGVT
jgi:hypothetical protein